MNENSKLTSTLWNWLDIQELRNPPHEPYSWIPERIGGSWWWRASRVLQDYDLNGNPREIIDEFPFFSFLLADLHPHVLSMPFVTLAISLSLNLFLSTDDWVIKGKSFKNVLTNLPYWVTCLILGSIAFINMWDFPIYLGLFLLTCLVKIVYKEGLNKKVVINFIKTSLVFGAGSVLLYLPFYLGFSSQAAGFLPSMNYFTRGVHFWIMFLPFLVPILVYLIWLDGKTIIKRRIWEGFKASIITIVGLWVISYLWAWFIAIRVQLLGGLSEIVRGGMQDRIVIASNDVNAFLSMHGGTGIRELIRKSFLNRISNPAMIITILILLSLSIAIMLNNICSGRSQLGDCDSINKKETINKNVHVFIGLMILIGTGLALFPEYFYLRDVFGWRMNTIFKFYFQVWVMWGLAGAFAVVVLWGKLSGVVGVLFRIFICIICVICMTYPIFGLLDKTLKFHPNRWDIDGTSYLSTSNIDEQSAVDYLRNVPYGVIVEAVGGSYSGFARISTLTGLPTVLGWPGHEVQWRGGTEEIGSRESDIDRLYTLVI
jgi:YYY domain-containing protein